MKEADFAGKMLQIEDDLREYEQAITDYRAFIEEMRAKYGRPQFRGIGMSVRVITGDCRDPTNA